MSPATLTLSWFTSEFPSSESLDFEPHLTATVYLAHYLRVPCASHAHMLLGAGADLNLRTPADPNCPVWHRRESNPFKKFEELLDLLTVPKVFVVFSFCTTYTHRNTVLVDPFFGKCKNRSCFYSIDTRSTTSCLQGNAFC